MIAWLLACGGKTGAVDAAADAKAEVYRWRAADANPAPEPLGTLLAQFYDVEVLLAVVRKGSALRVTVASAGPDGAQDRCVPTAALELAAGSDGAFTGSAPALPFGARRLPGTLHGATLSGTAPAGAFAIAVRGEVDTRDYLPLLGGGPDDALCAMVPAMGECVPCADGAPRCWTVSFAGDAAPVTAVTVEARTLEQLCADPACVSAPACEPG